MWRSDKVDQVSHTGSRSTSSGKTYSGVMWPNRYRVPNKIPAARDRCDGVMRSVNTEGRRCKGQDVPGQLVCVRVAPCWARRGTRTDDGVLESEGRHFVTERWSERIGVSTVLCMGMCICKC